MPNTVEEGARKWRTKCHWVALRRKLRVNLDDVRLNRSVSQAQVALTQTKLRRLMDEMGIYTDLRHQYLSYGLALESSQRRMRFMVDLVREHQILRYRFENRGLDPTVLSRIDTLMIYRTADS